MVFAPEAPPAVKGGAICVLLLTLLDVLVGLGWIKLASVWEVGIWYAFLRPGVRLVAGIAFAWGIAQMLGVFYWGWLVISVLIAPIVVVRTVIRMLSHSEGIGSVTFGPAPVVAGILWLLTTILLLSPGSVRAYCRDGRLWLKRSVEQPRA